MKKLNNQHIRNLSTENIDQEIIEIKKILFDFRLKQATRQEIKPNVIKAYKNQLARVMTIKHEKYFN